MSKGQRGFTLLEVVIALALLSIVLGALYSTFFLADRAVKGSEDLLLRMHEMRAAMDMMRREVEAALQPGNDGDEFSIRDRDFYGEQASELELSTFASTMPGPARVSYYVREVEDDEGKGLVLMKTLGPRDSRGEGFEAEAVERIVSFTVEARYRESWIKTWNSPGLPSEVRITITAPLKERELTLTETVRPRVGKKA